MFVLLAVLSMEEESERHVVQVYAFMCAALAEYKSARS
jgi:hypothetical protein